MFLMFSVFIFFVLSVSGELVLSPRTGEPSRNELTERTERSGEELLAGADGNGRDRSVFTWRGWVLAEAGLDNKSSRDEESGRRCGLVKRLCFEDQGEVSRHGG